MLFFVRLFIFAFLLVDPLAKIHDPANRRFGSGGNLNKIHPLLTSHRDTLMGLNNAKLIIVIIDQPDWRDSDTVINSQMFLTNCLSPDLSYFNSKTILFTSPSRRSEAKTEVHAFFLHLQSQIGN